MTEFGSVIDGKYEILKEIGRGGMSTVYLAMDKHLNKQWAVKVIRKEGNGKHETIVINSLIAEANMMKRLDHPALPRIVDIIDDGRMIYIIMDYIEGESLDKILNEYGAQPEAQVVNWAKQLGDALAYLHAQKPPIIYRDLKPANVMLKPEGHIKIIDFGIAREYKAQSLSDTTVLGTKGYAPPEQYSGQTDQRSDIFALGMTMHHLLTGVDPRNGDPYVPVRQWNPEISEGVEAIIDRCVEPVAENRYQSCADLLYDLEHPDLVTRGYKKRQKLKLTAFIVAASLAVTMTIAGFGLNLAAERVNNADYDKLLGTTQLTDYYDAIEIFPGRAEAYRKLIDHYKQHGTNNDEIKKLGNIIDNHADQLDAEKPEIAALYNGMGRLYFSEYEGSLKSRAAYALHYFSTAIEQGAAFEKQDIASCYHAICKFMTNQSKTAEHTLSDYHRILKEIAAAMASAEKSADNEANYDRISLYYVTMLFINDQAEYMAGVGLGKETVLDLLEDLHSKALAITSTLPYVVELQDKIRGSYADFERNLSAKYNEVEKRQNGGR